MSMEYTEYQDDDVYLTPDDRSHLRGLSIAYYVLGGIYALVSVFYLDLVWEGIKSVAGDPERPWASPTSGFIEVAMGVFLFTLSECISIAMIVSGRHLTRRTGYMFSFVLACIVCTSVPIGTVLGILTIVVLSRESVKAAYGRYSE